MRSWRATVVALVPEVVDGCLHVVDEVRTYPALPIDDPRDRFQADACFMGDVVHGRARSGNACWFMLSSCVTQVTGY